MPNLPPQKIPKARLSKPFESEQEEIIFNPIRMHIFCSSIGQEASKEITSPTIYNINTSAEAARKLYFSVSKTMNMAQRLYEAGLITYTRTDSVNLSQEARNAAAKEIISAFGENYSKIRNFSKIQRRSRSTEAIRPTNFRRILCL